MSSAIITEVCLGEVVDFLDSRRKPVRESDRIPGPYPYYGANGQQGTINDFLFDEPLVLLAEDGGHFFEPSRGIAYRLPERHGSTIMPCIATPIIFRH